MNFGILSVGAVREPPLRRTHGLFTASLEKYAPGRKTGRIVTPPGASRFRMTSSCRNAGRGACRDSGKTDVMLKSEATTFQCVSTVIVHLLENTGMVAEGFATLQNDKGVGKIFKVPGSSRWRGVLDHEAEKLVKWRSKLRFEAPGLVVWGGGASNV